MPEIDNVQIGETIAVEWGNAITTTPIQRYANAAERDELHPNPTEETSPTSKTPTAIEVYDGFAMGAGIPNQAVTTAKIADGAVTNSKIADQAVTTAEDRRRGGHQLEDRRRGDHQPDKIARAVNVTVQDRRQVDAVGTDQIADGHVTAEKSPAPPFPLRTGSATVRRASTSPDTGTSPPSLSTFRPPGPAGTVSPSPRPPPTRPNHDNTILLNVRIDGTDDAVFRYKSQAKAPPPWPAASFRSGITTTGSRTIASAETELARRRFPPDRFPLRRAFRTS